MDSEPRHCGACDNSCPAGEVCSLGMCNAFCKAGFGDCNMQSVDGCEVDLGTRAKNCGACGNVCGAANASVKCTTGICEIDTCTTGYADCDNVYNTGCEIDTQTDTNNCGVCGKVCANGMVCTAGVCVNTSISVTFEESFTNGQMASAQCTVWNTWRGNLTATFSKMTVYGTFNTTGISCTDATVVNNFAAALKNNTKYTAACDGNTWSLCDRYTGELWLNPPSECSGSNCPNGYIVCPCIGNNNWGGVNTATCGGATQTMGVRFE